MKLPRTNLYLLQNRILMILYAAGPRTNEEIAALLNNKPASVRGANSSNISLGFVSMTKSGNSEATFAITSDGVLRLKALPPTKPGQKIPPTRAHPAREKVLQAMRTGLRATDWAKVTTSKNRLYCIVDELQRLGFVISRTKDGKFVTYTLVSEPSKKGKPRASSLHPDQIRP